MARPSPTHARMTWGAALPAADAVVQSAEQAPARGLQEEAPALPAELFAPAPGIGPPLARGARAGSRDARLPAKWPSCASVFQAET